jgi:hypothetical protein
MKELARIALTMRISRCASRAGKEILDRAYGKAPQAPSDGLQQPGVTVINVLTGVPRAGLPPGTRVFP